MNRSTFIRSGIAAAAVAATGHNRAAAQHPSASPSASPAARVIVPAGPLGDQALWILDIANSDQSPIRFEEIREHFSESFLDGTTMADLMTMLSSLRTAGVTREIEPNSFITTRDLPASNGRFVLVGSDGARHAVSITIDRESGLITALEIKLHRASWSA